MAKNQQESPSINTIPEFSWDYSHYNWVSGSAIPRVLVYPNEFSIAAFVLGPLCLLPGIYALSHIIRAFKANNVEDRERALEDVPD